jgi:hypothetical protein
MGTVNIQRSDGSMSSYPATMLAIVGSTLHVRSPDHKGTLVIERAACSRHDAILTCLPTRVVLRQNGASHELPLASGTVYYNLTAMPQILAYSTQHLRPHGIILSLRTLRGTLINLDGTVDSGVFGR